ncbi:hypothetical protein BpHYR1_040224 [Brachionus plicatilis]|uniref:Uncharacterized protein n=1 Tax=Brachionus plicatilis TaxID=10195 RepID=A0A3M7S1T3_BRAPC|nr:hypothetical protein BpHYR1_040224 [Brachionus plicatilis]
MTHAFDPKLNLAFPLFSGSRYHGHGDNLEAVLAGHVLSLPNLFRVNPKYDIRLCYDSLFLHALDTNNDLTNHQQRVVLTESVLICSTNLISKIHLLIYMDLPFNEINI